jgi:hypothetical protein
MTHKFYHFKRENLSIYFINVIVSHLLNVNCPSQDWRIFVCLVISLLLWRSITIIILQLRYNDIFTVIT